MRAGVDGGRGLGCLCPVPPVSRRAWSLALPRQRPEGLCSGPPDPVSLAQPLPGGPPRWERPSSAERASRGLAAGPLAWRRSERFVLPAFPGSHGRGCWLSAARRLRCPELRGVGCVWRGWSETGGLKGGEPPWGSTSALAMSGSALLVPSWETAGVVVPRWACQGQTVLCKCITC